LCSQKKNQTRKKTKMAQEQTGVILNEGLDFFFFLSLFFRIVLYQIIKKKKSLKK